MVTVRNPVSRVVSAFNMEHPRNTVKKKDGDTTISLLENVHHTFRTFYLECFPTVEHLAQRLLLLGNKRNRRNTTDQECFVRGSKTLRGQGRPFVASHLKMNYGFYAKDTFGAYPERPVLVARTEHLWDDLKRIDLSLGGNGVFSSAGLAVTHGSEKRAVRDGLSQMGKEIICCYISNELSIYENLVRRAINLSPSEKEETLGQVYQDCGLTNSSWVLANEHGEGGGVFVAALERWRSARTDNSTDGTVTTTGTSFPWENWAASTDSGCPR